MRVLFSSSGLVINAAITRKTPPRFFALNAILLSLMIWHKPFSITILTPLTIEAIFTEKRFSFSLGTKRTSVSRMSKWMIAPPRCVALRLCLSPRTTFVGVSNGSASINCVFDDTMCQDAPLSKIHVSNPLDVLPPNCVVKTNSVPPPIALFPHSLGVLFGLEWHSFAKCLSFLQL